MARSALPERLAKTTKLNDSDQIGRAEFHRLMAILAGAVPEKDTVFPAPFITLENVERCYNPDSVFWRGRGAARPSWAQQPD